jgi:hypothetical protein
VDRAAEPFLVARALIERPWRITIQSAPSWPTIDSSTPIEYAITHSPKASLPNVRATKTARANVPA